MSNDASAQHAMQAELADLRREIAALRGNEPAAPWSEPERRSVSYTTQVDEVRHLATGAAADERDAHDALERATSVWSAEESIASNDENELATIRVRTMYNMVEELKVAKGATDSVMRLLYLTNMQAQLFKAETVPLLLRAFEVSTPSLVINLMSSQCYPRYYQLAFESEADKREVGGGQWGLNVQSSTHSFVSRDEATQACRRLINFFKEVLMPLAAETNAIVLCPASNVEALSTALAEVMPLFTAKSGGNLPFTVLSITPAAGILDYSTLYDPQSLSCEIANKSKYWKKALPKLEATAPNIAKEYDMSVQEYFKMNRTDLQPSLVNYIVVEAVSGRSSDNYKMDWSPVVTFQNELMQALSAQLPTLCVRTGGSLLAVPLTANVEFASRHIPVLMLDTQPRPSLELDVLPALKARAQKAGVAKQELEKADDAEDTKSALIELIIEQARGDASYGKSLQAPQEQALRAELEGSPIHWIDYDAKDPAVRDQVITKAIEKNLERHQQLWALGKVQSYDQHDLAYFYDVLNDDGEARTVVSLRRDKSSDKSGGSDQHSLYESLRDAEKANASGAGRPFTQEQLERVINHLVEMMAQSYIRCLSASKIQELAPGFDPTLPKLQQADFDPMDHWAEKMSETWSVYYDIYMSERLYGANLQNPFEVQSLIDGIVKRDRLPTKNSLEAQQLLRRAWNAVDICTYQATQYKRLAKAMFLVQLLLGLVVIVLTMFRDDW
eukprot:COSAG06_NODE_6514_length_2898_cov_3.997998_2_plen_729_part_01